MTKELVKSENGHKIIKHARHDSTHSLSSCSRIKMRITTPWLVILFLTVVYGDSTDQQQISHLQPEGITENGLQKTTASTDKTVFTNGVPSTIQVKSNDENDIPPDNDMTMEEILLFESLIDEEDDKRIENIRTSDTNLDKSNLKSDNININPENPIESKISTDVIDIRRQGEINPEVKEVKSNSNIQYDDSKQEVTNDTPPRYGQRSRKPKQKVQDEAPVLQLTEGGYNRPYRRPRFRNRYVSRPESSEQSENVQEPDRIPNNRRPEARRIAPQVAYSPSPQPPYAFGPGPILNTDFNVPARNMLAINHVMPTTAQNSFFNNPSVGFADYTTTPVQAQFQQSNDIGSFPSFIRDPNNVALYQASQTNPFQTPGASFQNTPQIPTQSVLIDPARNVPPHFQRNPFTSYSNYENVEDGSRPNNVPFFRNPTISNPFQVPPNFYGNAPNRMNTFNSPPINFVSYYPNSDDRLSSQFYRYPVGSDTQSNQENSNNQQLDSDASQEEKKAKIKEQETGSPGNRDDLNSAPFGTRLQVQNNADVYMRYPTNEAGYATEENLPSQNNSEELNDNSQQTNSDQRSIQSASPYNNVPTSHNQRINNSFGLPPELFRDAPIDFGYHRPQSEIFSQYPTRNRGIPSYPNPNFDSRNIFDPLTSLPENNYQYATVENERRSHQESGRVPTCAKQNNASVCFDDNDYPGNDILYSLNSNSYLADRLSGPDLSLNSVDLVERNASEKDQNTENYACAVDTKYGAPLRAKNLNGVWRIIVNLQGKFLQPVRMEVCKSLGDSCSYAESRVKTTCVQKYSLQRLLTWSPGRGVHSDVYKFPVACSCQIIEIVQA